MKWTTLAFWYNTYKNLDSVFEQFWGISTEHARWPIWKSFKQKAAVLKCSIKSCPKNFGRIPGEAPAMPANKYILKISNWNTRKRCEIFSKLTIKTSKRRQWRRSGIFIVKFEPILHHLLVLPVLTSKRYKWLLGVAEPYCRSRKTFTDFS